MDATYILRYAIADTPTSAARSVLNTVHNPIALRARATAGWDGRHWRAFTAVNYQGGYEDTDSLPHRSVSSWTTWDLVLGYRLNGLTAEAGAEIALSGQNVFNRDPPFVMNMAERIGYDEENGDLLGRRVSLQLKVRW
jgi:outer membrane receptor protein involved in Fe transport